MKFYFNNKYMYLRVLLEYQYLFEDNDMKSFQKYVRTDVNI